MEFAVGSTREEKTVQKISSRYNHEITLVLQNTKLHMQRVKVYEADKKNGMGFVC